MKTIYILWLRQLKRYFRSKSRIIGSLGQPILFLVALGFGFGPIYAKAGGGNYIQFLTPGIIAMSTLFTATFMGIELIWDKEFGFLKETMVAPVSRIKIMLGRTLGGATVAVLQGLIVFVLSLIIGFRPVNWLMAPLAMVFLALIAIIFTALGTAIASKMEDMHGFQLIVNFLIMPLFFLSGAIFPLNGVASGIKYVVMINPLTYGVDGLRAALTNVGTGVGILGDLGILLGVAIVLVAIGGYLFSKVEI
ncbi:ABC transporter permease [Candidatus Woesearchaeota archaeon]|nr:ABC transporter permease [Candidatus Woesearchaeota archaeon]